MAVNNKPKVLLFDLGGVIVPWVGLDALAHFNNITREQVAARFESSSIFSAFERGQASETDFLIELPRLFDLPDTDITALWNSWVHPPFPGIIAALTRLRARFTLGCLSNTNVLHWRHLNTIISLKEVFDVPLASHELQEAKPDAACYIRALDILGAAPKDVWFFDDTRVNIEAARALGMTAHLVDRRSGAMPVLRALLLID